MTAALHCDNCGTLASTRSKEGETGAAEGWYAVQRNPIIIGPGFSEADGALSAASAAMTDYDDERADEFLHITLSPPYHFCSLSCLQAWAVRQSDDILRT